MTDEKCTWVNDPENENHAYSTDCDNMFEFTEGGVKDNYFLFCPYCGKPIVENPTDKGGAIE